MKQYLTPEQTAKLIELGFEKPSPSFYQNGATWIQCEGNYSIGELIAIMPQTINVFYDLHILISHKGWWVLYGLIGDGDMWSIEHEVYRTDLVDALYGMIVKLKEEGVI